MTRERLMWHLENWRDWMRNDNNKLGYPSKSASFVGGGGSGDNQFEIMCESADNNCANKINALIDSLSKPKTTAIYHIWLKTKHHYPTQELDYEEAIESLIILCVKRKLD